MGGLGFRDPPMQLRPALIIAVLAAVAFAFGLLGAAFLRVAEQHRAWSSPEIFMLAMSLGIAAAAWLGWGLTRPLLACPSRAESLRTQLRASALLDTLVSTLVPTLERAVPSRPTHIQLPFAGARILLTEAEPIDGEVLKKLDGALQEGLQVFIDTFLIHTPQLVEDLARAAERQDRLEWARAAHTLEAVAASLGAVSLAQLAEWLEALERDGAPLDSTAVETIRSELQRVKLGLEAFPSQGPFTASTVK